jgi:hypothetical protein
MRVAKVGSPPKANGADNATAPRRVTRCAISWELAANQPADKTVGRPITVPSTRTKAAVFLSILGQLKGFYGGL